MKDPTSPVLWPASDDRSLLSVQLAVAVTIDRIDQNPHEKPRQEAHPIDPAELRHQIATAGQAEHRDQRKATGEAVERENGHADEVSQHRDLVSELFPSAFVREERSIP